MTSAVSGTFNQDFLNNVNSRPGSDTSVKGQEDKFLKLLVTQMKNQDPLNPMDNAEVTSQMAQLSTVTGIEKLNKTMEGMISNVQDGQKYQATNLIGREILASGNQINLQAGEGKYGFMMPQAADQTVVKIKNAGGVVVRTVDLGAIKSGVQTFIWDGKDDEGKAMAEGTYSYAVEAKAKGETVDASLLRFGKVNAITNSEVGPVAMLDGMDPVPVSAVLQIR